MRRHALNLGNALWSGPVGPLRYPEVPITGAITLDSSALHRMHVCTGTTADYTVTLPAVAGNTGKLLGVRMASLAALNKFVTIDGNASELINGALTRKMWAEEAALLLCDGVGWRKIAGLTVPMVAQMSLTAAQNALHGADTKVLLDTSSIDNTGTMVDITNSGLVIRRAGNYQAMGVVQYVSLVTDAGRVQTRVKNGTTLIANAEGYSIVGGGPAIPIAPLIVGAVADTIYLYAYQTTGATQALYVTTPNCKLFLAEVSAW